MMKKILFLLVAVLGTVACSGGRGSSEQTPISTVNQDIRTSSDMNIAPSNLVTPAPAVAKDTIDQKQMP